MIELDDWQKEFIEYKGDKILVAGRQTGKSEAQAYDNAEFSLSHPGTNALIISKTERQAGELLIKTLNYIQERYPGRIGKGKWKPLKSTIWLTHEGKKLSRIMCLPVGVGAEGIKGYTIHKLSIDEAQLVNDEIVDNVSPMLLVTGGKISMTGTPKGRAGHFWKAYENKSELWKVFRINSEQVINTRPICTTWSEKKKQNALNHLAREKIRMSKRMYMQEYLAEFVEGLGNYFEPELIRKVCILERPKERPMRYNIMGCDLARLGGDEITYEILDCSQGTIMQVENIIKKEQITTITEEEIRTLNLVWNLKHIGIDAGAGAMGVGLYDRLTSGQPKLRNVIAMNNRTISLNKDGSDKQRIFKEDLYDNLRSMMEKGELLLLNDDEIKASLESMQEEIEEIEREDLSKDVRTRIFSSYGHVVEGLTRAAWIARKEKVNKLVIRYI